MASVDTYLEKYLRELQEIRSSGEATGETSYYPPLRELLNSVGNEIKPKVRCILILKNRGAGLPDGGLFTKDQFQRLKDAEPLPGQKPGRGAIEVKSTSDDAWVTADSEQVTKYWREYGQVLVTNYRDFVLLGRDAEGSPVKLASYRLSGDEKAFWRLAAHPHKAAQEQGERFVDFLKLAMLSPAKLTEPKDVAWVLAYYAREAKARVETHAELPALANIRTALEQALGLKFEGEKGEHFFRSSLVQTLFYGVFSAWVLWNKQQSIASPATKKQSSASPFPAAKFEWRLAQWSLRVPMIRVLFEQVATPGNLGPLSLVEVLEWTASALNRVDRVEFFARFQEQEAVQYFYEPFLEAFDPELRKELGVWYTPIEIVKYMVARTHTVLREELNLEDDLADPNVYVLDPGCGTGAYLVEVLKTIAATLAAKGNDALAAQDVKQAAMRRVFGFELLPAPFVVSHLQLGLLLQNMGAPLADDGNERVGVYLTNSLTGWDPPKGPKQHLIFPEMEAERDAAENVKQRAKILVVIGNPPYNGFAGVGMQEERSLSSAYRSTKRVATPEGQGLNDLYIRFYRMAERRIVEQTGKGIVCFISNYSWLDGRSFTGMREHYLDSFTDIWIDNLHGDRIISEYTADGQTSETVFALQGKSPGIKVGTAIGILVAKKSRLQESHATLRYRDMDQARATERRLALLDSLKDDAFNAQYRVLNPMLTLGLPFKPREIASTFLDWPLLPQLMPSSFPGVKTSRDVFLVAMSRDDLEERLNSYFDTAVSDEAMSRIAPEVMESTPRFQASQVRVSLQGQGRASGFLVRYQYRPMDVRWLYWHPKTKLLDEKRIEYYQQVQPDNIWLSAGQRNRMARFYQPQFTTLLADHHIVESNVAMFPLLLHPEAQQELGSEFKPKPNMSASVASYLNAISSAPRTLFFHILSVLHSGEYSVENVDALRQDWPRIPLPSRQDTLVNSAQLGEAVAELLNTETAARGVTAGTIRPELNVIANVAASDGDTLEPTQDLLISVGWGRKDKEGRISAGQGKLIERDYTATEREAIVQGATALGLTPEQAFAQLGENTCDVYLNARAYWKNIPAKVWDYYIGGYQVIKKWLSYREGKLLGRALTVEEARYVRDMARRIAALCLMQPQLDANYSAIKAHTYGWRS